MDVDLDLEFSDRISNFLRSKLEEIKSENAELSSALHCREESSKKLRQNLSKTSHTKTLTFPKFFKKTINNKYVLVLELKNDSACTLTNITVTLTWTSSNPISYKSQIISSESLKPLLNLTTSALLIITLNIPFFTDRLSYTIDGLISFQQNTKKINVKFPSSILLTPEDITSTTVVTDIYKAIDGSREDFLAIATSGEKQEFIVVLPQNFDRLIEETLEDCALHRINLESDRKFFLGYKISPGLDGSLLELEGNSSDQVIQLNTYTKNFETTVALLHYLHNRITAIIIVPKPLYRPDLSLVELTDLAKTSLLEEVAHLEQASGDLRDFRTKIVNLEHETDILMARANEKRHINV